MDYPYAPVPNYPLPAPQYPPLTGLDMVQRYAGGGQVLPLPEGGKVAVGPGGGLDDLIPTTIDGHTAAELSDGEFVVPADVVSMMGDGSSSAGARRLYDLVKQVRQLKTNTDEQAPPLQFADLLRSLR